MNKTVARQLKGGPSPRNNMGEVQHTEWLGHSDISTTRMYDKWQSRPEDSPTFKVRYENVRASGVALVQAYASASPSGTLGAYSHKSMAPAA